MNKKNMDIRIEMFKNEITQQELANKLDMWRPNLTAKLRYTLSDKERKRLMQAIKELKNNKGGIIKE